MFVKVRKWAEFQHYKDRCPPWIKLHHSILDDFEFQSLPVASRALAPSIWLIASEHKEGVVDANYEKLAFRLRQTARQIEDALTPLIERGFLLVEPDASNAIADCQQSAVPETETETYKTTEKRRAIALPDWLPLDSWNGWIASRKNKPTAEAKRLAIIELEKLQVLGHDPKAVLEQSTMRGWTGLFPLKTEEPKKNGAPVWWASDSSIEAKGRELGLNPRPGENWQQFKGRINERLGLPI